MSLIRKKRLLSEDDTLKREEDPDMADMPLAIDTLARAPERIIRLSNNEMHGIPLEDQRDLHLRAARRKFDELIDKVPILAKLAEEQGVTRIASLENLGTLLVPHSASKSYPLSFIETGRFDRLTAWLHGFTAHNLSTVDMHGCETIDEWIDRLDAQSPMRVVHSTGTSGKLSFLPRDAETSFQYVPGYERQFDPFGAEPPLLGADARTTPLLYLQHRRGAYGQQRMLDAIQADIFGGNDEMIVALNPERLSADAISLGGRIRAADAKGEHGRIELGAKLASRRDEFIAQQRSADVYLQRFIEVLVERFSGRTVVVLGHIPQLYRVARAGLDRGLRNIFAPTSFVAGGGGLKGVDLPSDWRETVHDFLGPIKPTPGYGMSEMVGTFRPCSQGRFHLPPWVIPFILNHETGQQAPRSGVCTGRFSAFDLNAQNYWGGFISGDEVTLSWGDTSPCECGRIGPYVEPEIRRYTQSEGGDDKITCAGAPQAYDRALDNLLRKEG